MKKSIFAVIAVVSFSIPSFATNSVHLPKINKSEKKETPSEESLSCATLFVSTYNAWISLGHTPEDAYARATNIYNACAGLSPNPVITPGNVFTPGN